MSATTQLVPDGIYAILSAWSGSCVAFTDDTSSPRLQNCDVNSPQQQWDLQASSNVTYSIKNIAYSTYIAPIIPVQQSSYLQPSLVSYTWYLNNASQYIYTFAPDNTFSLGWDIQNIIEGNPLYLNLCCNNSGNAWFLVKLPNLPIESQSDRSWRIAGYVLVGLFGLLLLVDCLWYFERRERRERGFRRR